MTAPLRRVPIVVVGGMTASGKTELALTLARRLRGELVGADSVQVVRGFDIGSAKPTPAELGGVRHHLLDVVDPDEAIDAARYATLADGAIDDVASRGGVPIVVGGTGLWLRALVRGLVELPPPDPATRAKWEDRVRERGAPAVHAELAAIDPKAAAAIHPNDALRIVRALEVFDQTGQPLGELRHAHALGGNRYPTFFVVLDRERDVLRARIRARVAAMVDAGWVDEVRALFERWGGGVRAFGSVGYRDVLEHVMGQRTLEAAMDQAERSTWVYTRRQRTWLGSEPGIDRHLDAAHVDVDALVAEIETFVERAER